MRLIGPKSNREAIGAAVRLSTPEGMQSRMVKTGSSYLSQSELALIFGIGRRDRAERVLIEWSSGRVEEHKNVPAGNYECLEERGVKSLSR
ncbi:MAG: ASPIC/UnbV domain-containing protein [Bryobacteraceae bacterium]|jgi:hypothetical protein